jgi:hypothetical protein
MAHGEGAMGSTVDGEQAFWKAVPHLLAAGHHTVEELTEPRRPSNGQPYKIPRLMAAKVMGHMSHMCHIYVICFSMKAARMR